MKKNLPLVSAIIITHNRSRILKRAIESVLSQDYKNLEIIVVDDGSTDDTRTIVDEFLTSNSNIIYLKNEVAKGACHARNRGIAVASGDFIAGLDDDDEWSPNRITVFVENYDAQFSMLGSDDLISFGNGAATTTWEKKPIINFSDIANKNLFGNQAFIETERIRSLDGFDESLPSAQDYDMWFRVIQKFGAAKMIPKCLQTIHVEHEYKRISNSRRAFLGYFMFYRKHKGAMTANQRKYQLFNLYFTREKKLSFQMLRTLFVSKKRREMIRYYFMTSSLKVFIKKILISLGYKRKEKK